MINKELLLDIVQGVHPGKRLSSTELRGFTETVMHSALLYLPRRTDDVLGWWSEQQLKVIPKCFVRFRLLCLVKN